MQSMINPQDPDNITCVCGNTTASDGFMPYSDGHEVEPDDSWDGVTMFCGACFRVFDQNTGVVLSRQEHITFL